MNKKQWTKTSIGYERSFKVSKKEAKKLLDAWKAYLNGTDDGSLFDSLFEFGWNGDTLDFRVEGDTATVTVSFP